MINMYEPKLTNLQQAILRLFYIKAGMDLNAHAIAKLLKVSQPAVSKALPQLEKSGMLIIRKNKESKRLSIQLNRDNHKVIWLKRSDNLRQIYESGLVQFFFDKFPEATIILFGSCSTGEDTVKSDIDVAVIGSTQRYIDIKEFEEKLERPITLNYYKSFKEINRHLLNSILSGITLKGMVEL